MPRRDDGTPTPRRRPARRPSAPVLGPLPEGAAVQPLNETLAESASVPLNGQEDGPEPTGDGHEEAPAEALVAPTPPPPAPPPLPLGGAPVALPPQPRAETWPPPPPPPPPLGGRPGALPSFPPATEGPAAR